MKALPYSSNRSSACMHTTTRHLYGYHSAEKNAKLKLNIQTKSASKNFKNNAVYDCMYAKVGLFHYLHIL